MGETPAAAPAPDARRIVPTLAALFLMAAAAGSGARGQETGSRVDLPEPDRTGPVPVEEALEDRRSVRSYSDEPLELADVGQLLWAAQGITDRSGGLRAAPSAGALYPLELYLMSGTVDGLPEGIYHYSPERHTLERVEAGDRRSRLARAALGQRWVGDAGAVLVFTAVYARTARKYGSRARRYVHMEVGAAVENVYLQATARELATVVVGAFRDGEVREVLGLPEDHAPLALMPVGRPR